MHIQDLGYFHIARFKDIQTKGAYFISRLRSDISVFEFRNGNFCKININKISRKLRHGQHIELGVYIGSLELMPVRLIIEKVPKKVADEKRRKLKLLSKFKEKFISEKRLELCDVNTYITNASTSKISTQNIRAFYGIRWQIEILFKAWKSVFNIDKFNKMKVERFECNTYGTLLLIALTTQLYGYFKNEIYTKYKKEISTLKFFKLMKNKIELLCKALKGKIDQSHELIFFLKKAVYNNCLKESRYKSKSELEIIQNGSLN